jgi:hypothetical protein
MRTEVFSFISGGWGLRVEHCSLYVASGFAAVCNVTGVILLRCHMLSRFCLCCRRRNTWESLRFILHGVRRSVYENRIGIGAQRSHKMQKKWWHWTIGGVMHRVSYSNGKICFPKWQEKDCVAASQERVRRVS